MSEQHLEPGSAFPKKPIDRLLLPLERFLHVEAASGIILLLCTILALALANSPFGESYEAIWQTKVGFQFGGFEMVHKLRHWINDGLMVIFFFVIGLEVKRELVSGELREFRRAALPLLAALGGMVVPAGIFLSLQAGTPAEAGWGIPMATDIAFVVGCMALLAPRVPRGLRVLILSLAIADDIGAILVIAIGYTEELSLEYLLVALLLVALVLLFQRSGIRSFGVYAATGGVIWYFFHESGIHATLAGVVLGLLTPATAYLDTSVVGRFLKRTGDVLHGDWESLPDKAVRVRAVQQLSRETVSPLSYLENALHPWVSYLIMPVFALANAGVEFTPGDLASPVALAVALGLLIGKPVGIVLFSAIAVRAGIAALPSGVSWSILAGGAALAGIGFTMALFIAGLALEGELLSAAKVGILLGSGIAAVMGMLLLSTVAKRRPEQA
ncbi:MAG: Na+/H+ antiporter NhaA [Acidobacteriota bacterium]|jgi:Na+:H+ antiporter, NhaA family